jgi:hypothetical protein
MTDISIQSMMDRLCGAFVPERAEGVDATVQFDLKGDQGVNGLSPFKTRPAESNRQGRRCEFIFQRPGSRRAGCIVGKDGSNGGVYAGEGAISGDMGLAMRLAKLFDVKRL